MRRWTSQLPHPGHNTCSNCGSQNNTYIAAQVGSQRFRCAWCHECLVGSNVYGRLSKALLMYLFLKRNLAGPLLSLGQ